MKTIKTYETLHGNLNTIVRMGGKKIRIRFIARDNVHGYYTTSNTELQDAIEQDIDYGRLFDLHHEVEAVPQPELKKAEHIASWQAARELLHAEPYRVPLDKLRSPSGIERAAREKGLVFPNITA